MLEARYRIVYQGEIIEGFDAQEVEAALTRLFSLNQEAAEKLFGAERIIIKSNLEESRAVFYRKVLAEAGAKIYVEPMDSQMPPLPEEPTGREAPKEKKSIASYDSGGGMNRSAGATAPLAAKKMGFNFTGTGGEYFKIWIVNLLLSVVTLGIYSAWAKVRTRRYFYGNTRLDGASFEYLANPVAILKGRLIAFGFFVIYSVLSRYAPLVGAVLMVLFALFVPWLVVKSLAFNARNSAYRNVCFGFDGTLGNAAKAYLWWPIAGVFTLGALIPLAIYKQQRFLVENSRYGTHPFRFDATARPFYMVFLKTFLILILMVIIGGGIAGGLSMITGRPEMLPVFAIPVFLAYLFIFIYFNVKLFNLRYNSTGLTPHGFSASLRIGSYALLVLTNTLATVVTLGFFHPWAQVRTARYKLSRLELLAKGEIGAFAAAQEKKVSALGQEVGDVFDFEIAI